MRSICFKNLFFNHVSDSEVVIGGHLTAWLHVAVFVLTCLSILWFHLVHYISHLLHCGCVTNVSYQGLCWWSGFRNVGVWSSGLRSKYCWSLQFAIHSLLASSKGVKTLADNANIAFTYSTRAEAIDSLYLWASLEVSVDQSSMLRAISVSSFDLVLLRWWA